MSLVRQNQKKQSSNPFSQIHSVWKNARSLKESLDSLHKKDQKSEKHHSVQKEKTYLAAGLIKAPSKKVIAAAGIAAAAGFGAFKVFRHYLPKTQLPDEKTDYEYALLLGCPSHSDGSYSSSQKARCQLAIDAYAKGMFKTLIISGGAVKNEYVECEQMAKYIQERSSMPIILEDQARTTWQNLENTKKLIGDVPILILTGSLHARRASAMARHFFSSYGLLYYPDAKPNRILREIPSRYIYVKMEMEKDWRKLRKVMDFPKLKEPENAPAKQVR